MLKTIFLDRDGIINKDVGYVYKVEDFEFIEGVFASFQYLKEKGFCFIIVTNQSGIGRGYYNEQDFKKLTKWMLHKFKERGIAILDVLYCPHTPDDNCDCRKPKIGMFQQADTKYKIDKERSWMIGDKESDIEAATTFGISNTILVGDKHNIQKEHKAAKYTISSIKEISGYIA